VRIIERDIGIEGTDRADYGMVRVVSGGDHAEDISEDSLGEHPAEEFLARHGGKSGRDGVLPAGEAPRQILPLRDVDLDLVQLRAATGVAIASRRIEVLHVVRLDRDERNEERRRAQIVERLRVRVDLERESGDRQNLLHERGKDRVHDLRQGQRGIDGVIERAEAMGNLLTRKQRNYDQRDERADELTAIHRGGLHESVNGKREDQQRGQDSGEAREFHFSV
jgi:hypothetical protein